MKRSPVTESTDEKGRYIKEPRAESIVHFISLDKMKIYTARWVNSYGQQEYLRLKRAFHTREMAQEMLQRIKEVER